MLVVLAALVGEIRVDTMDEILALQQELARVQSAPSTFKLSEPNIVEVVQKLVELGLLEVAQALPPSFCSDQLHLA